MMSNHIFTNNYTSKYVTVFTSITKNSLLRVG